MIRIMRREGIVAAVRLGKRPRGFTLIEIMVGVMLLLVAMAGLVPLFVSGFSQSSAVRYKSTASNIAREKMESIRQLDYRDIPTDADDLGTVTNEGKTYLIGKFGGTEDVRGIVYSIDYAVEKVGYGTGALKEVTVEVGWTAPPEVVPVKLTTMFHQQYNGLRISRMEVHEPDPIDDLDSPFDQLSANSTPWLYVYIAEDDWDLAVDDLNGPSMAQKYGVYMKYDVVDELGASTLDEATREQQITYLDWDDSSGTVTDVFFKVQLDVASIPDGYWDFHAWAYNQYEEPGNRWTLRFLVENGNPDAPTGLYGIAQLDDESIQLFWNGTPDTDRDYYLLERRSRAYTDGVGWGLWTSWAPITDPDTLLKVEIDQSAVSWLDEGSAALLREPFGTTAKPREYLYRIYAVDTEGNEGAVCEMTLANSVIIPPGTYTTTTLGASTTTLSGPTTTVVQYYTISIESLVNKKWDVTITCDNPLQPTIPTTEVDGMTTVSISGLLAGSYHALATSPGKDDVEKDWTLGPLHDPSTPVMELY